MEAEMRMFSKWVKALAVVAEVDGMKAENMIRELKGESLAYNGDDFQKKADQLKRLAVELKYFGQISDVDENNKSANG